MNEIVEGSAAWSASSVSGGSLPGSLRGLSVWSASNTSGTMVNSLFPLDIPISLYTVTKSSR